MSDNSVLKPGSYRVWDTIGRAYCHEIFDMPFLDERGDLWFMSPGCERMDSQKGVNCVNLTKDFQPGRYVVERWTGLYDGAGEMVYQSSVTLWNGLLWLVIWRDGGYFKRRFDQPKDRGQPLSPLHLRTARVIGTAHDDPAELERRAREADDGPQDATQG